MRGLQLPDPRQKSKDRSRSPSPSSTGGLSPPNSVSRHSSTNSVSRQSSIRPTGSAASREEARALHAALQRSEIQVAEVKALLPSKAINVREETFGWSPLSFAASAGRAQVARMLLDARADMRLACHRGNGALHLAARGGHLAVVALLLEARAELAARNADGWSPLTWAAVAGRQDVVSALVEAGAPVSLPDFRGRTPWMWAAASGCEGTLCALLATGPDLTLRDSEGLTVMDHARAHEHVVRAVARAERRNFDLTDAAARGSLKSVRRALEAGALVNARDAEGASALQLAEAAGAAPVVQLLVQLGAAAPPPLAAAAGGSTGGGAGPFAAPSPARTLLRKTAGQSDAVREAQRAERRLLRSARQASWESVALYIRAGACLEAQDEGGRTALMWAAEHGDAKAVQLLCEAGAPLEQRDAAGLGALHLAVLGGRLFAVAALHHFGADLAAATHGGETAMHLAARADSASMVQVLHVGMPELVEAQDARGATPLQAAAAAGATAAAQALLYLGADAGVKDGQGRSLCMLAAEGGHLPLVRALLEPPPPLPRVWPDDRYRVDVAIPASRSSNASGGAARRGSSQAARPKRRAKAAAREGGGGLRPAPAPSVARTPRKGPRRSVKPGGHPKAPPAEGGAAAEAARASGDGDSAAEGPPQHPGGVRDSSGALLPRPAHLDAVPEVDESTGLLAEASPAASLRPCSAQPDGGGDGGGGADASSGDAHAGADEAAHGGAAAPCAVERRAAALEEPELGVGGARGSASGGAEEMADGASEDGRRTHRGAPEHLELEHLGEEADAQSEASGRLSAEPSRRCSTESHRNTESSTPACDDAVADEDLADLLHAAGRRRAALEAAHAAKPPWTPAVQQMLAEVDVDGRAALALAAQRGHLGVLSLLLARRAELDAADSRGRTALMASAELGDANAVRQLLAGGARVEPRDGAGKTAIDLAASRPVEELLRATGDRVLVERRLGASASAPVLPAAAPPAGQRPGSSQRLQPPGGPDEPPPPAAERPLVRLRLENLPKRLEAQSLELLIRKQLKVGMRGASMLGERMGKSMQVSVPVDPITSRPSGYAFAGFGTAAEAKAAAKCLSGMQLLDNVVYVVKPPSWQCSP